MKENAASSWIWTRATESTSDNDRQRYAKRATFYEWVCIISVNILESVCLSMRGSVCVKTDTFFWQWDGIWPRMNRDSGRKSFDHVGISLIGHLGQ